MNSQEIVMVLRRILRQINLESKRFDKAYGLSIPQLLALNFIKSQPDGQCSQLDLRNHLFLNSSTVTGIISRLESKGLIARLPKVDDKRLTRLALTSKGSKLINTVPPLLEERITKRITKLSDSKQQKVYEGLNTLAEIIEQEQE